MKRLSILILLILLLIPLNANAVRNELEFINGGDIASAGTLGLRDGNVFDVTGTTAITKIASKGVGSIVVLQFDGVLTLTHSTDLFLPSAANITTAAGDIAAFYEYAPGDWRCFNYMKASGASVDLASPGEIGGTTPAAGSFTDLSASGTLGGRLNRDFAKTSMTNGDTQTAFSEANMITTKYLTNQGETVELDVIFVAVSYPIGGVISNEEAQVIELCPPSGEIIYLDGVALDANDCVDSDGVVGSLASYLRFQDASAAWHYHILSITGAWSDTAGTD